MKTNHHIGVVISFTALAVFACAGSSPDFANKDKDKKDGKSQQDASTASEDVKADKPVEVAGAFLVPSCDYLDGGQASLTADLSGKTRPVGCGFYDAKDRRRADLGQCTTGMLLLEDDKRTAVSMRTLPSPEGTNYHLVGALPVEYSGRGYLELNATCAGKKATSFVATKDIHEDQALGTTGSTPTADSSTAGVSASEMDLRQHALAALHGSSIGLSPLPGENFLPDYYFVFDIKTDGFCKDGIATRTMSGTSQIFSTLANIFTNQVANTNIVGDVTYGPTPQALGQVSCFRTMHGNLAIEGNGCFFVRVADGSMWVLQKRGGGVDLPPGTTKDDVAFFVKKKGLCSH